MSWRLAKSLGALRQQYDAAYPQRSRAFDGTIGDLRHSRTRSEHNPDANGIVRAIDLTASGAVGLWLAAAALATLKARGQQGYVIHQGRIANPAVRGGAWRRYSGSNRHDHHVHVSVLSGVDSTKAWLLGKGGQLVTAPKVQTSGIPKDLAVDGKIGPATIAALQWHVGAKRDGIVGRMTVRAVQTWLGRTRTGLYGRGDIEALQRKVGAKVDGRWGPNTTTGLQRYLNRRIADAERVAR